MIRRPWKWTIDIMDRKRENCGTQICQCGSMLSPALVRGQWMSGWSQYEP